MHEQVTLTRDCEATQIPAGNPVLLKAGSPVTLVQALGGSYTATTEDGLLVRIDGHHADALGKEVAPLAPAAEAASGDVEQVVWRELATVFDPEIPVNIVELGLVYECTLSDVPEGQKRVDIKMSMTAPGCGMGDVLRADVERKVGAVPGVAAVSVQIVWDPPWDPGRMSEAARLQLGLY